MSLEQEVMSRLGTSLSNIFTIENIGYWIAIMLLMIFAGWMYKKINEWKKEWQDEDNLKDERATLQEVEKFVKII